MIRICTSSIKTIMLSIVVLFIQLSGDAQTINTVAGNGIAFFSGDGGLATYASVSLPSAVAVDPLGNIFIADYSNNRIRKVVALTGNIITVAGNGGNTNSGDGGMATNASIGNPIAVALDAVGNIYIAEYGTNSIRKVSATTGIISTIAGNNGYNFSGDGGPATSAALANPSGITVDASGNVYISDYGNSRIRKITAATGIITTIAGTGSFGYSGDGGLATLAKLNKPSGIAVDASGNVFFADNDNYRIRKITASTGIITTYVGNGSPTYYGDSIAATSASIYLYNPSGLCFDASGNLYFADASNQRVRKVTASTNIITTVAGSGIYGYSGDGGPATAAAFSGPSGVFVDAAGNLYIADRNNSRVRKVGLPCTPVLPTATITASPSNTICSGTSVTFSAAITNGGTSPTYQWKKNGIAVGANQPTYTDNTLVNGDVVICSLTSNATCASTPTVVSNTVTMIVNSGFSSGSTTGIISTVAGNGASGFAGDGGIATAANISLSAEVAVDASNNLYIVDQSNNRIRKVTYGTNIISTICGNGTAGFSGDGGLATAASLNSPTGVCVDGSGNIYIADYGNYRIRKITASTGIISTIAGSNTSGYSGDGGLAVNATLGNPYSMCFDASGNLYFTDQTNQRVRKIAANTNIISTIAGNGINGFSGDGSFATAASLNNPAGICVDAAGNIYIADKGNFRIRKVAASTNLISTFAGNGTKAFSGDGGSATAASISNISDITVDASGNFYIADYSNHRIRMVNGSTNIISTVAGNAQSGFMSDGVQATSTSLYYPVAVTNDALGNLYITDQFDFRIRKVVISSVVSNPTATITANPTGSICPGTLVAFTVTATNVGTVPTYQWFKNSVAISGATAATYSTTSLVNGDIITCTVTNPSSSCATSVVSNALTTVISSGVLPTISITPNPSNSICTGALVTFITTTTNAGTNPSYQWKKNGVIVTGETNSTYSSSALANGDSISCTVSNSGNTCIVPVTSNVITMTVSAAVSPTVSIISNANSLICSGTPISFTATITNGGISPTYQWKKNGLSLLGANNAVFTSSTLVNNDIITCVVTTSSSCGGNNTITSNSIVVNSIANNGNNTIYTNNGNCITNSGPLLVSNTTSAAQIVWYSNNTTLQTTSPTYASTGTTVAGGAFGIGAAQLYNPNGIFIDVAGNIYIADYWNHRVQKWSVGASAGVTVAGGNSAGSAANQLNGPISVFVDAAGNVYVSDALNYRVQKWAVGATSGVTVAGGNGKGTAANQLNAPGGIYVDGSGALYVADITANRIQKWVSGASTGVTVAGGNGAGSGANQFQNAQSVFVDGSGNLYVADGGNDRVQMWSVGGTSGTTIMGGTGRGNGTNQLSNPNTVIVDGIGNVYVSDYGNHRVQKLLVANSTIQTVAGGNGPGNANNQLYIPSGIALDTSGNIYVADANNRVQKWAESISNSYIAYSAGSYTATVTNYAGCSYTTNGFSLFNPGGSPTITITANPSGVICAGSNVTFTATGNNAGSTPTYQWTKNGVAIIGATASTYNTANLNNNDTIRCVITSSNLCASQLSVSSNSIIIAVGTNTNTPTLSIASNAIGTVCFGTNITYTTTALNAGLNPTYQWYKNSVAIVGATNSIYSSNSLNNNDTIKCVITTNNSCLLPTTSNSIVASISNSVTSTISIIASPSGAVCSGTLITFIASASNAGTNPSYQWLKNGVVINSATNSTYSSSTLSNNDVISCIVYPSISCAVSNSSNQIVTSISSSAQPTITVSSNTTGSICPNTSVTFTAVITNGGTNPSYQWIKNGVSIIGATSATYTTSSLNNFDIVSCILTSNATCVSSNIATSNYLLINVNNSTVASITINSNQPNSICSGTNVTFSTTITNGGSSPTYQWLKNNAIIVGANSPTYTTNTLNNNDSISCILYSNLNCATTTVSNTITTLVQSASTPTITLSANPSTPVCVGTSVTITASITNGGTNPSYIWVKNGAVVSGVSSNMYVSSNFNNNDLITAILLSNASCVAQNTVTSNPITINTISALVPSVSIMASPSSNICQGATVTFTASVNNAGTNPSYQWYKNGVLLNGFTSNTFTYNNFNNNDAILCVVTSNTNCVTTNTANSNTIVISVSTGVQNPTISISSSTGGNTICSGTSVTFSSNVTNGGISPTYQWTKNGVTIIGANSASYTTNTLINNDAIACTVTSNLSCALPATSNSIIVSVNTGVLPTVFINSNQSGTICQGTSVSFYANPNNGGATPSFVWLKNGIVVSGQTNSVYTTSSLNNNDNISCLMTSSISCASPISVLSNTLTVSVNTSNASSITITANPSGSVCNGTTINFSSSVVNGGTIPNYQWQKNGVNIPGAISSTYSSNTLNNFDVITCVFTSNQACSALSTSNSITTSILPNLVPTISISTNTSNTVCSGSTVVFTANTTNQGTLPNYVWSKNGVIISGVNSANYVSTSLNNNDVISCALYSNLACAVSPISSNTITMTVLPSVAASVSISAYPSGSICAGTSVTFIATSNNLSSNQTYVWMKNNQVDNSTTGATYTTTNLNNGDSISCIYNSNVTCANTPTSNKIVATVNPVPNITLGNLGGSCLNNAALKLTGASAATQIVWYNNNNLAATIYPTTNTGITVAGGNGSGSNANQLYAPTGVYVDASNSIYVTDATNNRVQKWISGATVGTTVAGGNGAGSAANQLNFPWSAVVDAAGNIYVSDYTNNRVQKWAPGASSGTTVAGGNGAGSAANQLNNPYGIFVDALGNIYIADQGNQRIQKWTPGAIAGITVAGGNGAGNASNQFNNPSGIFVDGAGNLYIADQGNQRIQKWQAGASSGTTVAGGKGNGSGANQLNYPSSLFVDGSGNIYVSDATYQRVQKWAPNATTGTTVAGGNGNGAYSNQLSIPMGIYVDGNNNLFIADQGNNRVQRWSLASSINTNYTPTSAGSYTAIVTNNYGCTAISNPIVVNPVVTPTITITSNPSGVIASGTSITFSSAVTYGGSTPIYQWTKNGVNILGATSDTYTSASLSNNDIIQCVLTSNESCISTGIANSNNLQLNIVSANLSFINGQIKNPLGKIIQNVTVTAKGTTKVISKTDNSGMFSIGVPNGSNEIIVPSKNNDIKKSNGVSTIDIALIQSHILQKNVLNSAYKIIAADVDNNGLVNTIDIVYIKRLILGLDTTFKGNRLWAFVDSSFTFTNPANPFPHKDSITYSGLSSNQSNQSFVGVKLGDVNYDWNSNVLRLSSIQNNPLILYYPDVTVDKNGWVRIPIQAKHFKDFIGMQFTFNFNSELLTFHSIEKNKLKVDYGNSNIDNGQLSLLWNDPNNIGQTLEDGTVLMELVFKAQSGLENTTLSLTSDIAEIEAWDSQFVKHNIEWNAGKIQVFPTETFVVGNDEYQVNPNPTKGKVQLKLSLKESKNIQFQLYNLQGKMVWSENIRGAKGISTIQADLQQHHSLPAGMYFLHGVGMEGNTVKRVVLY